MSCKDKTLFACFILKIYSREKSSSFFLKSENKRTPFKIYKNKKQQEIKRNALNTVLYELKLKESIKEYMVGEQKIKEKQNFRRWLEEKKVL